MARQLLLDRVVFAVDLIEPFELDFSTSWPYQNVGQLLIQVRPVRS